MLTLTWPHPLSTQSVINWRARSLFRGVPPWALLLLLQRGQQLCSQEWIPRILGSSSKIPPNLSNPLAILILYFNYVTFLGEVILINCTYWVGYHDHPTFLKIPVKHKNCKLILQIIQFKIKESLLKNLLKPLKKNKSFFTRMNLFTRKKQTCRLGERS